MADFRRCILAFALLALLIGLTPMPANAMVQAETRLGNLASPDIPTCGIPSLSPIHSPPSQVVENTNPAEMLLSSNLPTHNSTVVIVVVFALQQPVSGRANNPFTCAAQGTPLARTEGLTGLVGEIVLNCSGGSLSNVLVGVPSDPPERAVQRVYHLNSLPFVPPNFLWRERVAENFRNVQALAFVSDVCARNPAIGNLALITNPVGFYHPAWELLSSRRVEVPDPTKR